MRHINIHTHTLAHTLQHFALLPEIASDRHSHSNGNIDKDMFVAAPRALLAVAVVVAVVIVVAVQCCTVLAI